MYTVAWGLAHRQLQQDSWSRTDRSLWKGRAHTFPWLPFSLCSSCWWRGFLWMLMEPSAGHTDVWETLLENPSTAWIGLRKKSGWTIESKQWRWRRAYSWLGSPIGDAGKHSSSSGSRRRDSIRISSSRNILVSMFSLKNKDYLLLTFCFLST